MASAGQVKYPNDQSLWEVVFWSAVILTALSGGQWLYALLKERGYVASKPDLPLQAYVEAHISHMADGEERLVGVHNVLSQVRQSARLAKITVWGRRDEYGSSSSPLSPISASYWELAGICLESYLQYTDGRAAQTELKGNIFALSPAEKVFYWDLHLNRGQNRIAMRDAATANLFAAQIASDPSLPPPRPTNKLLPVPFASAYVLFDSTKNTYEVVKEENVVVRIQVDNDPTSIGRTQTHYAHLVLHGHRKFKPTVSSSAGIEATIVERGGDFVRVKLVWRPMYAAPMPTSGSVTFGFYHAGETR